MDQRYREVVGEWEIVYFELGFACNASNFSTIVLSDPSESEIVKVSCRSFGDHE